jgi:hypothetical protein
MLRGAKRIGVPTALGRVGVVVNDEPGKQRVMNTSWTPSIMRQRERRRQPAVVAARGAT